MVFAVFVKHGKYGACLVVTVSVCGAAVELVAVFIGKSLALSAKIAGVIQCHSVRVAQTSVGICAVVVPYVGKVVVPAIFKIEICVVAVIVIVRCRLFESGDRRLRGNDRYKR